MNKQIQSQIEINQPVVAQPVLTFESLAWVQCKDRRCLAYRDTTGQWTSFYTRKPVTDFVKVIY